MVLMVSERHCVITNPRPHMNEVRYLSSAFVVLPRPDFHQLARASGSSSSAAQQHCHHTPTPSRAQGDF